MGDESRYLDERDVRAVVNLMGRVGILEGDHRAKKRYLITGLAQLIDADVWAWIQTRWAGGNEPPIPFFMIDGGWASDQQKALFLQWHGDPTYHTTINERLKAIGQQGNHFTRTRQQILDDDEWYRSEHYRRWRKPANLDAFLYSTYPVGHDDQGRLAFSSFMFYRACGKPSFSQRDGCIVHLIASEVDWLHREGTDVPAAQHVADLPPRLYQVMLLLLAGDSTKQIAAKLELSQHTINDYTKSLHKRFGVSSRGELLAQFLAGDAARQGQTVREKEPADE